MKWFRSKSAPSAAENSDHGDSSLPDDANSLSKAAAKNDSRGAPGGSDLLAEAQHHLERGQNGKAFAKLNQLKAGRTRLEGVDFLRAHYFLKEGQPHGAIEALKE